MNKQEFINHVNNLRKNNKNKWYWLNEFVENKVIRIKGYNTWLQIYKVNEIDYSNCMDRPVKDFLSDLSKPF